MNKVKNIIASVVTNWFGPIFFFLLCLYALDSNSISLIQFKTDSIEKVIATCKDDTTKVKLINQLGIEYCESDADKSIGYSREAIKLSKTLGYASGLIDAYNAIGIAYDVVGKYDSAIFYYERSLAIAKQKAGNQRQVASIVNNIGLVNWNKGELDIALDYYLQSLKIFESIAYKKGEANTLSNIGLIYYDLKKFDKSLKYQLDALKIREEIKDDYGIGVSQTNVGMCYGNLHDLEKGLDYLRKSLLTKKRNKDSYGEAIALSDLGVMFNELQQYDSALYYQLQALPIRLKLNDKFGVITSYCNIASCYHDLKNYKTALEYSLKAEPIALELDSKTRLMKVYEYMAIEYKQLGRLSEALEYFEKYNKLKDKVYSEKSSAQIAEMQTKYDTQKKDLELAQKNLEINNNKLELEKQKNQQTILWFSIIAIALISYLLYLWNRYRQKVVLNEAIIKEQELRSKAIIEAEENERVRIARELHDGVGQHLSAVKLNISSLASTLSGNTDADKRMLNSALAIIDESVREVRTVSHNMMPGMLSEQGLEQTIRNFVSRISLSKSLNVEFDVHGLNGRLDSTVEIILYRVVQELLTNIIRHSQATEAVIQLIKHENELTLMVEDNGRGFDSRKSGNSGIGLKNIRSRIAYLDGAIEIDSRPQKGTTVTIDIPLKK